MGIFRRDGAPVDDALLRASVATMNFRGPHGSDSWSQGSVGLGHTRLRTVPESLVDRQPFTLHQRFSIVSDARLDSRRELIATLRQHHCVVPPLVPDSQLILHAYSVWGSQCLDHLRGDFAFVIWDHQQQKLFCARDHFGIRPFYFADLPGAFIFSNTLLTVLFYPQVSDELNDQAVGDFLLFGLNCDNSTTIYRQIRRLPPAHTLTVSSARLQQHCYWTPPTDGYIRYRQPAEYVENFQALLQEAVSDRLSIVRW